MLTDRVFSGEERLFELLVHDHNLLRTRRVLVSEPASANDGHSDRIEKACAHPIPVGEAILIGARCGMTLPDDAIAPLISAEREIARKAHVSQSRDRAEVVLELLVERGKLIEFVAG